MEFQWNSKILEVPTPAREPSLINSIWQPAAAVRAGPAATAGSPPVAPCGPPGRGGSSRSVRYWPAAGRCPRPRLPTRVAAAVASSAAAAGLASPSQRC